MQGYFPNWVRKVLASVTLASLVLSPFSIFFSGEAKAAETPEKSAVTPDTSGYDFVMDQIGANSGAPTHGLRKINTSNDSGDNVLSEGSFDEGAALMSGENPLLQTHIYHVANNVQNSMVNGVAGNFTHSVPIVIPPGRNGMEPSLALNYASSENNELNVVGYGWDIPIPYIQRFNKMGIEELYSTTTPTYFISSMSGELATTSNSSAYVARSDDGSFLQYNFSTSSNQWTVKDKSGSVYKFGYASTTRQDNPDDSSQVYKWMLEEVRDPNGNYISYEYYKDSGFIYPSQITYTGNGITDGIFTVDFSREVRPDWATSSVAGFESVAKYRIDEISASINGQWVRKYDLSYTTGSNGQRSLLDTVTESARTEEIMPTTASLQVVNFDYQEEVPGWATTTDFALPEKFISGGTYEDAGLRAVDINGDALPDLIRAKQGTTTKVYINTGDNWELDAGWSFPEYFITSAGVDTGLRFGDLNGDGYNDFILGGGSTYSVYLNTGSGWATTTHWHPPFSQGFAGSNGEDLGSRLADVNGDGLVDLVHAQYFPQFSIENNYVYLNTGETWEQVDWQLPSYFQETWLINGVGVYITHGSLIDDINNDGLADVISNDINLGNYNGVYINQGDGTWEEVDSWEMPELIGSQGNDVGQRLLDVNGDKLPDWIGGPNGGTIYINNGSNWVEDSSWVLPLSFASTDGYSSQAVDVNGDGMIDIIQRNDSTHNRYLNRGKLTDTLTHIDESSGGEINVTYKGSPQYTEGSEILNSALPFVVNTVQAVVYNDGLDTISTTTYEYRNGAFYYEKPDERTFAGFGIVEKTDSEGNIIKTYYHQGNTSSTTLGEYDDKRAKIGKSYRTEFYDDSNNLYDAQINKWDLTNRGGEADVVQTTRSITLSYDGDGDHRDIGTTYSYSTTTGDINEKVEWGEVTGSSDGTFSDTGTDKFTTTYTYAASSTGYLVQPSRELVQNQSSTTIRDSKNYYDTLSHGYINAGNLTKQERWVIGGTYIDTEKTYNTYGLVTQEKDPRNKITAYTYDTFNLYPATTTNSLSQITGQLFDYSSGKVRQVTDVNSRVFQTSFDEFDRIQEEKQPSISSPTPLVTRSQYQYTDTGMPRRIQKTDYLDASTTVDTYTYLNGTGKKVQERIEAEGSNTYSVKDLFYNTRGLLRAESLPYFSSSTSYTATSSPVDADLLSTYTYDPLERILTVANTIGTSTNAYDQWTTATTNVAGIRKETSKNAYGDLVQVVEAAGDLDYTTAYEYDGNKNLTKITDAAGNIRNFTYDGLSRRLTAQDLHDAVDGAYGVWTYAYDAAGNMASTTDPKGQVVEYTYDDINRVLTENYTGAVGTEISYGYDICPEGKGRLCSATTTDAISNYTYNALGLIANESKIIENNSYATSYEYDRLGNISTLTYPDNSEVRYGYNSAGLLESIEQKESGGSFAYVVTNLDYAPTGKIAYKELGSGTKSSYIYDENELYRLKRILTVASSTEMGDLLAFAGGSMDENFSSIFAQSIAPLSSNLQIQLLDEFTAFEEASSTIAEVPTAEGTTTQANANDDIVEEIEMEDTVALENPDDTLATSTQATTTEEIVAPEIVEEKEVATTTDILPTTELEAGPYKDESDKYVYTLDVTEANSGDSEIEINKNRPEVLFKKWDGEINVGVSYEPVKGPAMKAHSSDSIEWTGAAESVQAYPLDAKQGMEDGGFEIEVHLNEYPASNKFDFAITGAENLDFFYQAPLWEQNGYSGPVSDCTDTECREGEAHVSMPENVVGSYAVYHKTKANYVEDETNYATGKVFHIFRPKAIDSSGHEVWGELSYADDKLSVTIPEEFLIDADYPVRVDPTFGYTSVGATIEGWSANNLVVYNSETLSENGDVSKLTVYEQGDTGTVNVKGVVYAAGSPPGSRKGVTATTSVSTTAQWRDYTFASPVYLAAGNYALGTVSDGAHVVYRDNTAGYTRYVKNSGTFNSPANPFSSDSSMASRRGSIYATYTASSSNAAPSAPSSLLTEGQTNPAGVTDATPEFSAIYNDSDTSDIAVSYKIQVSTSSIFASMTWDSGKTTLASSTSQGGPIADISYAGSSLASSTTYYWRIKFWDTADTEGAWSTSTSTFALGASTSSGVATPIYMTMATTSWAATSNITIGRPTGLEEGDLMIALIAMDSAVPSAPYGWELIEGAAIAQDRAGLAVFGKIATSSDVTTTDYTFSGGSTHAITGGIARITNAKFEDLQSSLVYKNPWSQGVTTFTPGVTPAQENSLLMLVFHGMAKSETFSNHAIANDNPTWIEREDSLTTIDVDHMWTVATAERSSATTTGDFSVTTSGPDSNKRGYGLVLSIASNTAPSEPTGLEVEGDTNPSVTDSTPEFSAVFEDDDSSDTAAHYQIQVATSSDFSSTYWDSGKSALSTSTAVGNRSPEISYSGSALNIGTTYYWRIKFWDKHGRPGEWSSENSSFFYSISGLTGVIQDINFTYDEIGNITSIQDRSGTAAARIVEYEYEDLNRLTSASTTAASSTPYVQTFSYNSIGNITNKSDVGSYTYAETGYTNPHAPTSINGVSLAYDNSGNLTSYGSKGYSWDYRNRLATSTGVATSTYGYDHSSQRVVKSSGGTLTIYPNRFFDTDGSDVTKHIFAGDELIATIGATNEEENLMQFGESMTMSESQFMLGALNSEESTDTYKLTLPSASSNKGKSEVTLMKETPEVHLKKWDGEIDLGISYEDVGPLDSKADLKETGRIEWKGSQKEVHAYPLASSWGMEDGGFEIEVYLKDAPGSNKFDFTITGAEDLDFFYQEPLWKQNGYAEPTDECSDTECVEGSGAHVSMPENVIGSYAVYHKTKANYLKGDINYTTGKAFHIYRPKAIDAEGDEVWGTMTYENGTLSVEIPQEFLNNAEYPVRVDPTFGYTSIGATIEGWSPNNLIVYNSETLTENGDVTKLTIYEQGDVSTVNTKGVIYAAGSPPGALEGVTTPTSVSTTAQWREYTFASPISLTAGNYALGTVSDGAHVVYRDNTPGYTRYEKTSGTYASPVDPFSSDGNTASRRGSIYATYTASEGGGISSTTIKYIHSDHLGGTNVVTNEQGDIVQLLDYYPFGDERISSGDEATDHHYIGERFDEESDLSYLNARYYEGGRGQFLTQDSSFLEIGDSAFKENYERTLQMHLMNPQALNSYSYALDNPIMYSDPEGEIVPLLVLGALAFYGGYSAGTDLYEGYANGDSGQFTWGVVGAAGSLIPGGGVAKAATNLTTNFYRGGNVVFDAKDFAKTLANGKINPNKAIEGISVSLSEAFAATKGGFATQIKSLPKGLQITQQGRNLNHYVIRPVREMTVKEFRALINKLNSRLKSLNSR